MLDTNYINVFIAFCITKGWVVTRRGDRIIMKRLKNDY
jgi:hypothetical protein